MTEFIERIILDWFGFVNLFVVLIYFIIFFFRSSHAHKTSQWNRHQITLMPEMYLVCEQGGFKWNTQNLMAQKKNKIVFMSCISVLHNHFGCDFRTLAKL